MTSIKSANEIILNLIDFFKSAQPDLDTKPGTVARDLFIDAPATQLALLYDELSRVSTKQSLRTVIGQDLDKLGKNFGQVRRQSTFATGVAILTFSSDLSPITIKKGDLVIALNGFAYSINSGTTILPANSNFYRSIASKYRNELDAIGISDEYAIEVSVTATSAGISGNIGKFSLTRTNISGISNVTNVVAFSGGTNQENDDVFRNRILSVFSGSSTGTALGYQNIAFGTEGVLDAVVIEPGDPLMTRDGTITKKNADGTLEIVSEGTGGKVDIVVLGNVLTENTDSYIYIDKSNQNDPTSSKNDFVLGQIDGDENKTINKKRRDNIKSGVLPEQPVYLITEVSGSLSGSNFIEKSIDEFGRVSGNYELVKDDSIVAGSPWAQDKIKWISNKVSLFNEDKIKGQFNGQDTTSFSDVLEIPKIQQNISITNENSIVTSDRSVIQLLHYPATNVTRVFNVNTGERYLITDQNFDGDSVINTTGRIQISGNTLPNQSDTLQVDYNWIVSFDQYTDYDGLVNTSNSRNVVDSIDWGYSSLVKNEKIRFDLNTTSTFFVGNTTLPITSILSAKKFLQTNGVVYKVASGIFVNRLAVNITNLPTETLTVDSVKYKNTNIELYNTSDQNNTFINTSIVVGTEVRYLTTIILPTDTKAQEDDIVEVWLNAKDVFTVNNISGTTSNTTITIPFDNVDTLATQIILLVDYIASPSELLNYGVSSLPLSRLGQGFVRSNVGYNQSSNTNCFKYENLVVQQDLSLSYYIQLSVLASEFTLLKDDVVTVVRLSDGLELYNLNNQGTITTGSSGNIQIVLNGYNTPATGDRVLVVYKPIDSKRFQPFGFTNQLIGYRIDTLSKNLNNLLYVNLNKFIDQNSIEFYVLSNTSNIETVFVTDGYLTVNPLDESEAFISSLTKNFGLYPELLLNQILIVNAETINDGYFDILSYDDTTNVITIKRNLSKIDKNQISVIRLNNGKDLWSSSGSIEDNIVYLSEDTLANVNDKVVVLFYNYKNSRSSPCMLSASISDQVSNNGIISIYGNTITKAQDVVFTSTLNGLKLNINEAIRKVLSLNSTTAIPSNVKLVRIAKLEKVTTVSITSDEVLQILATYDLKNTSLKENVYYSHDFTQDLTLGNLDFVLPATIINSANEPSVGDKFRITFYYVTENDLENLSYTRNGVLYTNKLFAFINKLYVSSGFRTSQSTRLSLIALNQPSLGARYKVFYDYLAPKQNERIFIRYNYNRLISNVTFAIENSRPINADILVRGNKEVLLDVTVNIVIETAMKKSTNTIVQNVRDILISTLTTNKLGQLIDENDILNAAKSISGVNRARVLYFNVSGQSGKVTKVQAQKDESFVSNNVIVNVETK